MPQFPRGRMQNEEVELNKLWFCFNTNARFTENPSVTIRTSAQSQQKVVQQQLPQSHQYLSVNV